MPRAAKIVPEAAPATPPATEPGPMAVRVPLADLYLSPLNPRQDHDADGIAALAESLRTLGLMQNLAGLRDPDGRVGIVAGGRRLAALPLAVEARPELAMPLVLLAPDEATARLWALAENTARAGLHIVDEVRAYRRMVEGGAALPTIAAAFAVTEAHVRRRLKLAHLPTPILDALKAGQISVGHAQVFTLCADEARQMQALADVTQRRMGEDSLRRILIQEQVRSDDRRAVFVGLDAYQEAGGTLTRDLFADEDDPYLDDPALLERLFVEKLAAAAEARRAEGWRWTEARDDAYLPYDVGSRMARLYPLPDNLTDEQEEELAALHDAADAGDLDDAGCERLDELEAARTTSYAPEHRAVAGGWVYVDRYGELREALGFVRPEHRDEAVEAGAVEAPRPVPAYPGAPIPEGSVAGEEAAKGAYSYALVDDMRAIRLAAAQTALLGHPDLVLDLLGFALTPESGWPGRILGVRPERQTIRPSEDEALAADPRLGDGAVAYQDPESPLASFAAFRGVGEAHRNEVITAALARTLRYAGGPTDRGRSLFEQIEREAGASIRAIWRPTARNFFGRVNGAVLDDLLKDLLDRTDADPAFRAFRAMKKAEKVAAMDRLFSDPAYQDSWLATPEQRARIDAWVPPCA